MERLPREQQEQTRSLIGAAWKLDAKEGMTRLRELAEWLRDDYPDAAGSLLEGKGECFTINRLKVLPSLHRCLATMNLIESSQSECGCERVVFVVGVRPCPPVGWGCSSFPGDREDFRRIMDYRDLWALKAILRGEQQMKAKQAAA